ncbi:MAG: SpoIIE family protein phosphatase, partial [Leptospiraceae bacterium]|nr:SpoIIE family protein phosphatase [Leptospiraceae bacterium]
STVYHPLAAYHRYLTVSFVELAAIHFCHFFWNFPNNPKKGLSRFLLVAQWIICLGLTLLFILRTYDGERWFRFSAHYWDFAEWEVSSYIANQIAVTVLLVPIIAIWKMTRNDRRLRWTIFWMMLAYLAGTLIPAIANKLSHAGKMSRGSFQILYNLMTILGFFALIVIYINKTLDRTTFMAKIVGISLVTILVIFQWLSYASYIQAENAYDRLHNKDMRLTMVSGQRESDLQYLLRFDPASGTTRIVYSSKNTNRVPDDLSNQFRVMETYHEILRFPDPSVAFDSPYLQGYSRFLQSMAKIPYSQRRSNLPEGMNDLQKELRIRRIEIQKTPRRQLESLRNQIRKGADDPGPLQSFDAAALQAWSESEQTALEDSTPGTTDDPKIKETLMRYYLPVHPEGQRFYRSLPDYGHVICFALPGNDGAYYEAAYSYLDYRRGQMDVASRELLMLLGCLLIVIVGFRFFFGQTLTNPLMALLQGVQRINRGDLAIRLPVQVQDEIGFLTGSFNRMVGSIRRARKQLEGYAITLEDRVQERTNELEATVKRIQELKTRQDGDFFLTSLLIHPLTSNQVQSSTIKTDALLLQKKRFAFRRWEGEIGGDFCSSHNILLRGKSYVVFLNGDAMGKSLQGAAGALILGSVFESIIQRTELSGEIQSLPPEMWLRDAYLELQKIFCTFDGYMMASVVLGLVEEETGLLYFLNAEHPWPVLYRNGKAHFPVLPEERIMHKLGILQAEENLRIYTLALEHGDVFISGSDGRDDIILGEDDQGNRIYNMNESLILDVVENARGDIRQVPELLSEKGQISDDLSLLRIEFLGSNPNRDPILEQSVASELSAMSESSRVGFIEERIHAIRSEERPVPSIYLRKRFEEYFRKHDFEQAAEAADELLEHDSESARYLYLASYACKRAGRIEQSRIHGERALLRDPNHANNLVNLADIYRMLGHLEKAEGCIRAAMQLRPGHKSALLIQSTLEQLKEELR